MGYRETAATVMFDCTLEDYGAWKRWYSRSEKSDHPGEHYGTETVRTGEGYSLNLR